MANTDIYDSDLEDGNASAYNAGDESDDESLIGVDSPTDGYFERRALPRETFAANPNVVRSAEQEEDKAGEAAGERQRARSRSVERAAGSRAHARIAVGNEEPTPILDAGPAPPDYAAATAHRREETVRYGTLASSPEFQSDHPLVRNGLFGEQGVLGNYTLISRTYCSLLPRTLKYIQKNAQMFIYKYACIRMHIKHSCFVAEDGLAMKLQLSFCSSSGHDRSSLTNLAKAVQTW